MQSIIQEDKTKCFLCGKNGCSDRLEEHHIFGGSNRKKSEKYGLKVYLCGNEHHRLGEYSAHKNVNISNKLKRMAQFTAMSHYGWSEDDFRRIFGKSYI